MLLPLLLKRRLRETGSEEPVDPRRLRRAILSYTTGTVLVLVLLTALLVVLPVYRELQQAQHDRLEQVALTRSLGAWQFIWHMDNIALQVAGRTRPRDLLEQYNAGELSPEQYRREAATALHDAVEPAENLAGITRLAADRQPVIQAGEPVPESFWPDPVDVQHPIGRSEPIQIDGDFFIIYRTPIVSEDGQKIGTDLLLYRLDELVRLLADRSGLGQTGRLMLLVPNEPPHAFWVPWGTAEPELIEAPPATHGVAALAEQVDRGDEPVSFEMPARRVAGAGGQLWSAHVIPGTDWVALATMELDELYSPVNRQLTLMLGGVFVLALLGTAGMVLIVRPLTSGIIVRADELQRKNTQITEALQSERQQRQQYEAARDELAIRAAQQATISQLGMRALENRSLSALLAYACEQINQTLCVPYTMILELDTEQRRVYPRAWAGFEQSDEQIQRELTVDVKDEHIQMIRQYQPLVVADRRDPDAPPFPQMIVDLGVMSALGVVIGGENQPYGVMIAHDTSPRAFTSDDRTFLQGAANLLGQAIIRYRASAELQRLNQTLEQRVAGRTSALERSNRELEQFAYIASHDLQEPLRKVEAFGQMLADEAGDHLDEQARDYLNRMQSASRRMKSLIEDLLAYSRVTTKAQPPRHVDLNELVDQILQDLEISIRETDARVTVGDLPRIEADPAQMRQLFQNLISNALKFHKPGVRPVVDIQAEPAKDRSSSAAAEAGAAMHRIHVCDQGIGFEQQYVDRIFRPFQRLHGRDEYPGTGMGLAVCRKIVHRHGGRISVRSAPEQGACFTVELPVTQSLSRDEAA